MGNYVESGLTSGERVVYTGFVSFWSLLPLLVFGVPLSLIFGLMMVVSLFMGEGFGIALGAVLGFPGFVCLAAAAIRYRTTELAITNKRVIAKFGFISRSTIELSVTRVESIQVKQGVLGRLLDYGTIIISGAGNPQAPVPGISGPMEFRRAFLNTQECLAKGS